MRIPSQKRRVICPEPPGTVTEIERLIARAVIEAGREERA